MKILSLLFFIVISLNVLQGQKRFNSFVKNYEIIPPGTVYAGDSLFIDDTSKDLK